MTGPGVAVHELGGSGQPLVISHATGFHGWCYEPMARHLAPTFRCVAFDYRGHGDTPLPDGWEIDWQGYGDDAESVVAELATGGRGLVGFGHSMGGACLLMVAHRRPGLLRRLVLFEPVVPVPGLPGPSADPADSPLVAAALRRRDTFGSLDEAFTNYASKPPLAVFDPDALWEYVRHGFAEQPDGSVRLKCAPSTEAGTFAMGGKHDTWELLPVIDIPVLIVMGGRGADQAGPALGAPAVAEALPQGSLLRLDRLDHFGPMSHPDVVADAITTFTAFPGHTTRSLRRR